MPELVILTGPLPDNTAPLWIVIDAPVSVTLARAQADRGRGVSREPAFHHAAHERFREYLPTIPAHAIFDSQHLAPHQIPAAIAEKLEAGPGVEVPGRPTTGPGDDGPRPRTRHL